MTERITSGREARAAINDRAIKPGTLIFMVEGIYQITAVHLYGDIIAEAIELEYTSDDGDDMTPTGIRCLWTAADMIGAEF